MLPPVAKIELLGTKLARIWIPVLLRPAQLRPPYDIHGRNGVWCASLAIGIQPSIRAP